jgi:hypothetical protein
MSRVLRHLLRRPRLSLSESHSAALMRAAAGACQACGAEPPTHCVCARCLAFARQLSAPPHGTKRSSGASVGGIAHTSSS